MEPDCYKVEILHFINPYLIWVEVPNGSAETVDNFCFEQIGVFGVLPLEMTMNAVDDTLTTKRSSDWMPAATVLMKNVLADAIEVSFCPLQIDNRTTIFDDNTHKYGEIIIKKPNGKYRLLSKLLVKSGCAIYDDGAFQTELSSGKIKTKLGHNRIKDIVKQLEKKCKAQVAKQTTVFQAAQQIESTLTVKNLQAHNQRTMKMPKDFDNILQKKLEDLQLCKEAEQESVGRATKKKKSDSDSNSLLLKQKIRLLKGHQRENVTDIADLFVKQHIEDLSALQKPHMTEKLRHFEHHTDNLRNDSIDDRIIKQLNKEKPLIQNELLKTQNELYEKQNNESARIRKNSEKLTEVSMKEVKSEDRSFESDQLDYETPKRLRKPKKMNKTPNKVLDYDIHTESRIAYGPPGTNLTVLPCKVVPKDKFIEIFDPAEVRQDGVPMKKERQDIFDEEDSDVGLENAKDFQLKPLSVSKNLASRTSHIEVSLSNNLETVKKAVETPNIPKDVSSVNISKKTDQNHHQIFKQETTASSILKRKLRIHKETMKHISSTTSDSSNKDSDKINTSKDLDSDDESLSDVIEKLNLEYEPLTLPKEEEPVISQAILKNHVNPFKNVDTNISKFVEKLVTPVLMVHSKMNKRFKPTFKLRDVPFNTHIQIILKNMSIDKPMILQMVTWPSILKGHSTFIIGPKRSGKTMGYLPAVCRLVSDQDSGIDSVGPMSIIVCATSNSVSEVEMFAKMFLGKKEKVLAIYSGMNELDIATSLLNGCDLLICTPAILVRLLQADFGVDLRRLTTFVLDDCERLTDVFANDIKFFLFKIKDMLKNRVQKEAKVQYILSSRIWCDFMEPLGRKAPDTVICIGAFQECVLYSKTNTSASFVTKENKFRSVLDFLKGIDTSKKSVIVCRTDEEVEELEKILIDAKYVVFACNSEMTVQNLYNLRGTWDDYQEPVIGPILLCLDGNLTHLNITDAHYLVHYSLPSLFSVFCKRFSVLNDNYPSIFNNQNEDVKIKILLEDVNVEQLPKILNFIKRCTTEVPTVLDEICEHILVEKDKAKAKKLVPICDNLLTLGECSDFWNCQERHAVVKEIDEPKDWVPKEGMIAFKILHFHTAVLYSARLLSNTIKGQSVKYPQNYNMLSMKISMYFSRESNRKLHGVPQVGDICAVSIKQNFFARCQVVKILSLYENGKPNYVLVRLTDEEKLEKTRDIDLYHLPEQLATTQTHVVHVRLANLKPRDKDITFSELARDQLKKISEGEEDLYMRGQISLTIGNCVILESVEACRDLSTLNKTVVLHDFNKVLLEKHAMLNNNYLQKLRKLCIEGGIQISIEKSLDLVESCEPVKQLPAPQWAHLEKDDLSAVLFASAENPSTFFVRLVKFEDSCTDLVKDIQKYAAEASETLTSVSEGDVVLARLPDDDMFERARIDEILNNDKVKCFFVDQGDWREVSKQNLIPITEKLITQLPFQAIECRLVGVKPPGDNWTEFATNWFTNCFEDNAGILKQIYAKYFTKEKSHYTGGHKYGVVLVDTYSDQDVILNDLIMEVNLAEGKETEIDFLNELNFNKEPAKIPKELSDVEDVDDSWEKVSKASSNLDDFEQPNVVLNHLFPPKPVRSVPLVDSDESDVSEDRWQINMTKDFMPLFKPMKKQNTRDVLISNLPAIKNVNSRSSTEVSSNEKPCKNLSSQAHASSASDTDSSVQKLSSASEIQIVQGPNIKELDSDDYTSPESSLLATKAEKERKLLKEITTSRIPTETNKTNKNTTAMKTEKDAINEPDPLRKPKLLWHQRKKTVIIKLLLIGVERYDLIIGERQLKFYAIANDTEYGFDLELYGVIDRSTSCHSNKGQYIRISLSKVLDRNWLTLTRSCGLQKWIVYDVDSLDVDSSDEETDDQMSKDVIKHICDNQINTDSEDEEFLDDANFGYSR